MNYSYVCDIIHSCVSHDSFICVTWLIHPCDMTHSHDSFICVTWLIHMCDMTHSYAWHDSFICVTWLIHMRDMTHSYAWHDSFICVPWHIHMCAIKHSYMRDMTRSNMWVDCVVERRVCGGRGLGGEGGGIVTGRTFCGCPALTSSWRCSLIFWMSTKKNLSKRPVSMKRDPQNNWCTWYIYIWFMPSSNTRGYETWMNETYETCIFNRRVFFVYDIFTCSLIAGVAKSRNFTC